CMVQDVVVQPIWRQDVTTVIGFIERPVVAEALWAKNQYAVVAQFVVLDDGQCLEGLTQPYTVRNDAPAEAGQLVDSTYHAVALKLVELFPNDCVPDTRSRLHDLVFIHRIAFQ